VTTFFFVQFFAFFAAEKGRRRRRARRWNGFRYRNVGDQALVVVVYERTRMSVVVVVVPAVPNVPKWVTLPSLFLLPTSTGVMTMIMSLQRLRRSLRGRLGRGFRNIVVAAAVVVLVMDAHLVVADVVVLEDDLTRRRDAVVSGCRRGRHGFLCLLLWQAGSEAPLRAAIGHSPAFRVKRILIGADCRRRSFSMGEIVLRVRRLRRTRAFARVELSTDNASLEP